MAEKLLALHIEPQPKERPKARVVTAKGKKPFAQIYTPKTTAEYEQKVANAWKTANGDQPFEGPVVVRMVIGLPIPKSISKKRREAMLAMKERPTKTPDVDNLAKSIMDALNHLAYKDDSHVVSLTVKKYYMDPPKILLKVAEWFPDDQ